MMRKNFNTIIFIGLSVTIYFSAFLYADENDTSGITMKVPSICKLTIKNSDQTINLLQDASGEAAYEEGFVEGGKNSPVLTVDANTNWKLSAKVSSDWSKVGKYKKETEDLLLKIESKAAHQIGFSEFMPLSRTEQEIATYGTGVNDDVYNGQYRILLDWEKDIPGNYSIIVTYTLSTKSI